jgi:hypothetical protein
MSMVLDFGGSLIFVVELLLAEASQVSGRNCTCMYLNLARRVLVKYLLLHLGIVRLVAPKIWGWEAVEFIGIYHLLIHQNYLPT